MRIVRALLLVGVLAAGASIIAGGVATLNALPISDIGANAAALFASIAQAAFAAAAAALVLFVGGRVLTRTLRRRPQ